MGIYFTGRLRHFMRSHRDGIKTAVIHSPSRKIHPAISRLPLDLVEFTCWKDQVHLESLVFTQTTQTYADYIRLVLHLCTVVLEICE